MKHLVLDFDEEGIPGYIEVIQTSTLPKGVWSSNRVSIQVVDNIIKMYYTHKETPDDYDLEWAQWILTGRYLTPFNEDMQEIIKKVNDKWDNVFPRLRTISENDSPLILDFIWNKYRNLYIDARE